VLSDSQPIDREKPIDISNFRKANRLTQDDLASLLGVTLQAVKYWESGKRNIQYPTLLLLGVLNRFPSLINQIKDPNHGHYNKTI
jgi:DNA-binding transcriptional regulator YiaG